MLGDRVSSGLGVQGMLWATSPACTEVEMQVLDSLVRMLALPEAFLSSGSGGGVIQDSASSSSLRDSGRATTRDWISQQRRRLPRGIDRVHFQAGTLVNREGSESSRNRQAQLALD